MTKPKIGFALGSGGARGWCHIGVLRELAEAGIEPDVVAGASMGALVGGTYVAGGLDALEEWSTTVDWRKIAGFLDVSLTSGGLIEGKRIVELLNTFKLDAPIESFAKPFTAVASDLVSGREIWLQKGPMSEAVRASIALPGIISPVKVGGQWLLDGGMTNPVPVSACRAMGADIIVAVNPNAHMLGPHGRRGAITAIRAGAAPAPDLFDRLLDPVPESIRSGVKAVASRFLGSGSDAPGYFDVLSTSIDIMTNQILRSRLAGEPPHVIIGPQLSHLAVLEFNRAREIIEEGRRSAKSAIPVLKEYLS